MIDLLIMQNIELRHEDQLVHFQLVNICNQVRDSRRGQSLS